MRRPTRVSSSFPRSAWWLVVACSLVLALKPVTGLLPTVGAQAPDGVEALALTPFPNCRLGAAILGAPTSYNLTGLNLGWYVNYSTQTSPLTPDGLEFVQIVRIHQQKTGWCRDCYVLPYAYSMENPPDAATLRARAQANPGATWLIGNEPDRRDWSTGGQDEIVPELYAQAYHDIRAIILDADPTARIGTGGIIQGTPLRLKYLDRIWNRYQVLYGRRWGDDVDVWNLHSFILNEKKNDYGAEIPAGLSDSQGITMDCGQNDSMTYFKQFIVNIRTWMRDKGERNKPLYISEYGINMPDYCVTSKELKAFMNSSFDYLLNTSDTNLGYPIDGNRLVQRLMWYSLDDSADSPSRVEDYADSLFSSVTHLRQDYGNNWYNYIQSTASSHREANTPRVNLLATETRTTPSSYFSPSHPVTFTLRAEIYNNGNTRTDSGDGIQITFYSGTPAGGHALIGRQVISDLCGCGFGHVVVQSWSINPPTPGAYPWYVEAEGLSGESGASDNIATGMALITSIRGPYLPIIVKAAAG